MSRQILALRSDGKIGPIVPGKASAWFAGVVGKITQDWIGGKASQKNRGGGDDSGGDGSSSPRYGVLF